LAGFVHPASGRTVWHLAATVNIELFSVEMEAFALQIGANPTKQIVLVLIENDPAPRTGSGIVVHATTMWRETVSPLFFVPFIFEDLSLAKSL
jgi:hypothetical protein